ncbi:MAG: hypothetical protein ABEI99_03475 [Halobaculum sp.]
MATKNPNSDGLAQHADQSLSRYDFMLALMPLPIVAGVLATVVGQLPTVSGLGFGSFLSALVVGYGLFFDNPSA